MITVFILILSIVFSGCLQTPSENSHNNKKPNIPRETIYVGHDSNEDFQNIQDAINAAKNGDTIYVQEGRYYGTLYINKTLNLISAGENKSYIIGNNTQLLSRITIIQLNADNCSVDGFIITMNGSTISVGINIRSSNNTIINNTITNTTEGIFIENNTQKNTIIWNNITNSLYGIKVESSLKNTFAHNSITSNSLYGIYISYSSDQNIVYNNTFYKNNFGLRIKGSSDNKIFYNCFINNSWGLYLCCSAYYNTIYNNVFKLNNESNVYENKGLINYFNVSSDGGNYYDDYTGVDSNNDGFGDTPYYIKDSGNQDSKPLIKPINFPSYKDIDYKSS